ncbi:MAG: tetratricopeptide repeat protein [Candidatus Hydrogenedentes bacterium]|nr:tetratricopeptide repeat protein [Candidatus Hydrogenedentota bacterium]
MYGYPRLFPLIEGSHADHFEENVADAMAEGNVRKAARIARWATQARPLDPMAYTVYGRVLLECDRADEALEQLTKAVGVRMEPAPSYRGTRKAFYFAAARLTLGKYYLEQGKLPDAVANFELARAYAVPADVEYGDYHAALYEAYAKKRLWARALEFRQPTDEELDALDGQDLVLLARVCEGEKDWALAERVAERLIAHDVVEGRYLLGRVELAGEQYGEAAADLEQAASGGRVHAAFFLGLALEHKGEPEQAVHAYARMPSGDLYRPFALARAATLLQNEGSETTAAPARDEFLSQLDSEIAALRQTKQPVPQDVYHRLTLVAFTASPLYFESGARFPICILWRDKKPSTDAEPIASLLVSDGGNSITLRRNAETVLQLEWVENRVNWQSISLAATDVGEAPGWIDTARDWFGLRPDYAAQIEHEAQNYYLSINRMTWFYSVPVPVRHGISYLVAGRLKGPQNKAGLHWQALDDEEHVLAENTVYGDMPGAWDRSASYFRSQLDWDFARVELCVAPQAGPVAFDDVMLVEVTEPDIK